MKSGVEKLIYIGYGRENISPRYPDGNFIPVRTAGYPQTRVCNKILTELYASCTAFRDAEGETALLFSIDNIGLPADYTEYAFNKISEATGVSKDRIILNATHTHTAPGLYFTDREENVYYMDNIFFDGIVKSAKRALADLALCTEVYAGTVDGTGYNFIRRYDTDEQGNLSHEIEGDHTMPVVRFVREGKKDVILANWAAHCDSIDMTNFKNFYSVASDYVGALRDTIENNLNANASMQIGDNGDVNPF